jgi:ABC-type iron transport system FetAB ATPase subunit/GNAT superfamily N-acetyltransferase
MHATITLESRIIETPRVAQLRGLFDLPARATSRLEWEVSLPLEERAWNIGLITGPSGCGKSTIARRFWPAELEHSSTLNWPADRALVDAFPPEISIKDASALLSAVGFSSPPAWLRPYSVLSTGQQFRATLARLLAEARPLVVCDEFTSVVDRTVARIGSAALARAVRARKRQFVAVSCHDDVIDWLQPDWVYRPAEESFEWRRLRRRPAVVLEVARCRPEHWRLFAPHPYLSHGLVPSATCFLARWEGKPVAFSAWLPFLGAGRPTRREHRTVTLPDYQGVGIGHALSSLLASMWRGLGYRATSTTTHPALIQTRRRSPFWALRRAPSLAAGRRERLGKLRHATTRLTAGFEYTGPALSRRLARLLCGLPPFE